MIATVKTRFKIALDDYTKADDPDKFKLQWIKGIPTNKTALQANPNQ